VTAADALLPAASASAEPKTSAVAIAAARRSLDVCVAERFLAVGADMVILFIVVPPDAVCSTLRYSAVTGM
jgi:hypothetical protein